MSSDAEGGPTFLPLARRERIEEPALSLPKGEGPCAARDLFSRAIQDSVAGLLTQPL